MSFTAHKLFALEIPKGSRPTLLSLQQNEKRWLQNRQIGGQEKASLVNQYYTVLEQGRQS